ncbi:hypothetical protein GOBAR_AA12686 [Gossypium barbadense]|uniref:Uncharacterized protein n=1 Tax=Gossypium barbadense TaxID=3634 RepID=A0A2P5XX68_GOSBA|nr:hypothetical protein GOBAR_AA12686 [Gossypium barbadense]
MEKQGQGRCSFDIFCNKIPDSITYFISWCYSSVFSSKLAFRDSRDSIVRVQEISTSSSGRTEDSVINDHPFSSGSSSTLSASSCHVTTASANNPVVRTSTGDPSEINGAIAQSNHTRQNGISIFQGLIERARSTVRGSANDIGWLKRAPEMPSVEDGTGRFTEILENIRHGLHKLPSSMVYLLVPGNKKPCQKQRPDLTCLERQKQQPYFQAENDGLGNDGVIPQLFTSLPALNEAASYLAQTTNYLAGYFSGYSVMTKIIDVLRDLGLFSNHGPLYFVSTKTSFSKMGLTCHIAKIHSEASVEKNAKEIKDYIEEIYWGSGKRVLLLGHSKGGVDAAAALSMYWSDLKGKVAGLVLAQSPYGGSPIASDILREGQLGDYVNLRKHMEILICKVLKGDMQAMEDLTYKRRKEFLQKHHLPKELPVVSFHTEASISPAVLATLSRVAHAELPMMAPLSDGQPARLPVVMPLGAAMAACAQLLLVRYKEQSDGLVARCDAEVPGSIVVRPKRKLDHAWMVYSSLRDDPSEADAAQVCETLLTLLVEVGQKKIHELSMKDE